MPLEESRAPAVAAAAGLRAGSTITRVHPEIALARAVVKQPELHELWGNLADSSTGPKFHGRRRQIQAPLKLGQKI